MQRVYASKIENYATKQASQSYITSRAQIATTPPPSGPYLAPQLLTPPLNRRRQPKLLPIPFPFGPSPACRNLIPTPAARPVAASSPSASGQAARASGGGIAALRLGAGRAGRGQGHQAV